MAWLIDRSDRGKLALSGPERADFLQGLVTNDVEALAPGEGCWAAVLTHKGKLIGDLRVLATADELLLDCERAALQGIFNVLHRGRVGRAAELHKRTLQRALFSVLGAEPPGAELTHAPAELGGAPVRMIATDLGYDVLCDSEDAERVRSAIDAEPADAAVAEVLRVESGRPRWGFELDDTVIPQEAGLNERFVSFTKGCYVGQETVARLHYKGKPNRHLRGLRLSGPGARHGDALLLGEREVGQIGTAVESPTHGHIALALVRREAEPGATLRVGDLTAEVVELPFTPVPARS